MFSLLVILFTVIPAIEIYLLITIGNSIGGLNTMLIVIATGIIGAALAKSQGLAIINKIQSNVSQGQIPTDQFIHGLLVFGGGLLLLTPGVLTDVLGLSMVFPGTRYLWVSSSKKWFTQAVKSGNIHVHTTTFSGREFEDINHGHRPQDPNVIEADFTKKDESK